MRAFAAVALTVVLMSACGGDPTPIEPTATASKPTATLAAPTADTTLKPPTLPKVARQNDSTGAANFVAYWVRAFNYAASTGRTSVMRRYASECVACTAYADDFEALPREKLVTGNAWTITTVETQRTSVGFNVETVIRAKGETKQYPLTFVLRSDNPFRLVHIFERPS